jgi:hypothetical protein
VFRIFKGAIFLAPFLCIPFLTHAYTTHLFCECIYTYPQDPPGEIEFCPEDADVDVYVDADVGFFQFGLNDNWEPLSITNDLLISETFSEDVEEGFTQRITATLDRFNGRLLVQYDGFFEDYGSSLFSDLHYCTLVPAKKQF